MNDPVNERCAASPAGSLQLRQVPRVPSPTPRASLPAGLAPLTLTRAGKVVVILGHVGHDAEAVGDAHGDHVLGVQESRDAQLLLSHFKGLGSGRCRGRRKEQPQQEEGEEAGSVGAPQLRPSLAPLRGTRGQGRGDCGQPSALTPQDDLEKGRCSRDRQAGGKQGSGKGATLPTPHPWLPSVRDSPNGYSRTHCPWKVNQNLCKRQRGGGTWRRWPGKGVSADRARWRGLS